jgi:hypothetical protein
MIGPSFNPWQDHKTREGKESCHQRADSRDPLIGKNLDTD